MNFIKYAKCVIAANNGLNDINLITDDMIDAEYDNTKKYLFLITNGNGKVSDKLIYEFWNQDFNELFSLKKDKKNGVRIPPFVPTDNITDIKKTIDDIENDKKIINPTEKVSNIFNTKSYLSKNCLSGISIDKITAKLFFISTYTPYKPAFNVSNYGKIHLYYDLSTKYLIQFIKILKNEYFDTIKNDVYISEKINNKKKSFFTNPFPANFHSNNINDFKIKNYQLIKFFFLKHLRSISDYIKITDLELYNELKKCVIYENNIKNKCLYVFNIKDDLLNIFFDERDNIYEFIKFHNYFIYNKEYEYTDITYLLCSILRAPKNLNNLQNLLNLKIKYYKHPERINIKFIKTMEKFIETFLEKEIREKIKEISNEIKGKTYSFVCDTYKSKKDIDEKYDFFLEKIFYAIKAIKTAKEFYTLPNTIKNKINRKINMGELLDLCYDNNVDIESVKKTFAFYLYTNTKTDEKLQKINIEEKDDVL